MFLVLTMSSDNPSPPLAAELQNGLEQCGIMLTKKNIAAEENFTIEVHELFDTSFLTLHPLFALPVCWAAVKLRPTPGKPLNDEIFDDFEEVVDAAAVIAFPECIKKMELPALLDISRCSRITLPPRGSSKEPEDALLIYSYQSNQPNSNNNGTGTTNGNGVEQFMAENEEVDCMMTSLTLTSPSDFGDDDLASPMSNGSVSDSGSTAV